MKKDSRVMGVYLYGASGHAKVIIDIINANVNGNDNNYSNDNVNDNDNCLAGCNNDNVNVNDNA